MPPCCVQHSAASRYANRRCVLSAISAEASPTTRLYVGVYRSFILSPSFAANPLIYYCRSSQYRLEMRRALTSKDVTAIVERNVLFVISFLLC